MTFEAPGEVALVGGAGGEGDPGERFIGGDELTSGKVHTQPADMVAHSIPAVLSENAGQVDRVDANCCRDHFMREILSEPGLKQFSDLWKPARWLPLRVAGAARTFGQNLKH